MARQRAVVALERSLEPAAGVGGDRRYAARSVRPAATAIGRRHGTEPAATSLRTTSPCKIPENGDAYALRRVDLTFRGTEPVTGCSSLGSRHGADTAIAICRGSQRQWGSQRRGPAALLAPECLSGGRRSHVMAIGSGSPPALASLDQHSPAFSATTTPAKDDSGRKLSARST